MAKWVAFENRHSTVTLLYKDVVAGVLHDCGELRRDTPPSMIVSWIVAQDTTSPGDIIKLPDGTGLLVQNDPMASA